MTILLEMKPDLGFWQLTTQFLCNEGFGSHIRKLISMLCSFKGTWPVAETTPSSFKEKERTLTTSSAPSRKNWQILVVGEF